ncbi:MAG: hypothetical protein ACREBB_06615 [Nitrosotalea sp.]
MSEQWIIYTILKEEDRLYFDENLEAYKNPKSNPERTSFQDLHSLVNQTIKKTSPEALCTNFEDAYDNLKELKVIFAKNIPYDENGKTKRKTITNLNYEHPYVYTMIDHERYEAKQLAETPQAHKSETFNLMCKKGFYTTLMQSLANLQEMIDGRSPNQTNIFSHFYQIPLPARKGILKDLDILIQQLDDEIEKLKNQRDF